LTRRTEIRRQRWRLKRRELELLASKNLLLPRVDLLGTYRIKGFGRDLFGHGNELQTDAGVTTQLDSSAFGTFFNGDLQEWEIGLDASIPIGFRHQHAAVRHAELNLAREKSVLVEQPNQKRLEAANEQYAAIQNIYQEQDTTIDLVLEAQRRVIESKLQFFQSQVEYMLAVKAIHFEQGTLFQYHNIQFGEADAAFAEFDSVMAADLITTEPIGQQRLLFERQIQQVPVQPNAPVQQPIQTSPRETTSHAITGQPKLTAPAPSLTADSAKPLPKKPRLRLDGKQSSQRNMFDAQ